MMRLVLRCLLSGAVLLGVVGVTGGCGEESEALPLKGTVGLLTYNVAGLPDYISGSNPEVNMVQISALLNPYDLVLVQEDFSYHQDLMGDLDHPYQTEPAALRTRLMHDGLNRFSRYPFRDHQREQWVACFGGTSSGSGDCLAEKGFSVAITEFAEGIDVHVYNLHVEAGGGEKDHRAREEGVLQLINFVQTYSAGEAVLIAGDFNLHGSDPIEGPLLTRLIEELELGDSCTFLKCGTELIDRVLFRSSEGVELTPLTWEIPDHFVDAKGGPLSDHDPVHVEISWTRR